MNDSTRQANLQWLRCDLHNHCEDHDLIEAYVGRAAECLDVVALSNHAQKPIFFEQHRMIERVRQLLPEQLVLFGMEWNAPLGVHANLLFPPGPKEAENAYAFARAYDRLGSGRQPVPEESLAALAELPADQRPVLFFNHPANGQWTGETIARYLEADRGRVIAGIEAVHGHQLHAKIAALDPFTYPGSAVGGLCDGVYAGQRSFALLAHSDFHVHKMSYQPDYTLGAFNHSLVGVPSGRWGATKLFSALRSGRTCAAQGHWLDLRAFHLDSARIGDTWRGGPRRGWIELAAEEDLEHVELIGQLDGDRAPAVLRELGPLKSGLHRYPFEVPADARGFVRLRVAAASRRRPHPGPDGIKLFQTAAILLAP